MSKVALGFDPNTIRVPLDNLLPSRKIAIGLLQSRKYLQILASIREVGIIEPLSVIAADAAAGTYLLLDGHVRVVAMRDLGYTEANCLIAKDDEGYTYNTRINRVSSIQEHRMIRRAIDRGVSREKVANTLGVDVSLIHKKASLLDGVCDKAIEMLKDRQFSTNVTSVLKRMKPMRQVQCVELMIDCNKFTSDYTNALLTLTPPDMLVDSANPYAHLNDRDSYSALRNIPNMASQQGSTSIPDEAYPKLRQKMAEDYESLTGNAKGKRRHSDIEIERKAIDLQKRLWLDKTKIWSDTAIADPIDILDPSVAFGLLGFDFELADTLGLCSSDGKQVEVAGIIDDAEKSVRISRQFPFDVRNFTAAHELGHALLHDARGLHRDRPLDGTTIARSGIEFEADRFATYFLMPSKVVRARFSQHFGTEKFFLNEATGFALARGNSFDPVQKCRTLRDLSRVLASVESYNGVRFRSLASQFRVSVEAMAIRLEELELLTIGAE